MLYITNGLVIKYIEFIVEVYHSGVAIELLGGY